MLEKLTDTTTTVTEYFLGTDLSGSLQDAGGVGGLVAVSVNDKFYFPLYDNNGNIIHYVDESGALVASYTYDAFGKTIAQSGTLAEKFRFCYSTKYHDPETDYYYYGYRFYSPHLGRWLTRDPIGERGGLNLYGFVGNNPLNQFDYLGMIDPEACIVRLTEMYAKTKKLYNELKKYDPIGDARGGFPMKYPPYFTHKNGHWEEMKSLQNGLKKTAFLRCLLMVVIVLQQWKMER